MSSARCGTIPTTPSTTADCPRGACDEEERQTSEPEPGDSPASAARAARNGRRRCHDPAHLLHGYGELPAAADRQRRVQYLRLLDVPGRHFLSWYQPPAGRELLSLGCQPQDRAPSPFQIES